VAQPLFQTEKVVSPEVEKEADDLYEYHPWTEKQKEAGENVRKALRAAHLVIVGNVPPGPDRTVALRKCREVRMIANSGITNGGRY
jgi:hypothetical protein